MLTYKVEVTNLTEEQAQAVADAIAIGWESGDVAGSPTVTILTNDGGKLRRVSRVEYATA